MSAPDRSVLAKHSKRQPSPCRMKDLANLLPRYCLLARPAVLDTLTQDARFNENDVERIKTRANIDREKTPTEFR